MFTLPSCRVVSGQRESLRPKWEIDGSSAVSAAETLVGKECWVRGEAEQCEMGRPDFPGQSGQPSADSNRQDERPTMAGFYRSRVGLLFLCQLQRDSELCLGNKFQRSLYKSWAKTGGTHWKLALTLKCVDYWAHQIGSFWEQLAGDLRVFWHVFWC